MYRKLLVCDHNLTDRGTARAIIPVGIILSASNTCLSLQRSAMSVAGDEPISRAPAERHVECYSVARYYSDKDNDAPSTDFLALILKLIKPIINAAFLQEFIMCPHLTNPSLVHHDNLVGVLNGRQPMRDHNRRAIRH